MQIWHKKKKMKLVGKKNSADFHDESGITKAPDQEIVGNIRRKAFKEIKQSQNRCARD